MKHFCYEHKVTNSGKASLEGLDAFIITHCSHLCDIDCPQPECAAAQATIDEIESTSLCGYINFTSGPFENCPQDPRSMASFFLESCVFDLCMEYPNETLMCQHACHYIDQFTAVCRDLGHGVAGVSCGKCTW